MAQNNPDQPRHRKGANAEDCPACGPTVPYPWICPGQDTPPEDAGATATPAGPEFDVFTDTNVLAGAYGIVEVSARGAEDDPSMLRFDVTAEVEAGPGGASARVKVGPKTSPHERTVTVYVDPSSGALVVDVDGPFENAAPDELELRVYVNDNPVYASRPKAS